MKRLIIGAAAAACAAALLVPGGAGARETFTTEIDLVNVDNHESGRALVYGVLRSEKAKCRSGRKMELLSDAGGGFELLDTGRSSRNGAWAFDIDNDDLFAVKIKVAGKTVGGDTCKAAKAVFV